MEFKLYIPQFVDNGRYTLFPEPDQAEIEDRTFIVSENAELAQDLLTSASSVDTKKTPFTKELFNDFLGEALDGKRRCDLAFLHMHEGGILVATMGEARLIQVRPATGEVMYDSRNQVLDIYSEKAMIQELTDVFDDDYFLLCSNDNIDSAAVTKILCDETLSDGSKRDRLVEYIGQDNAMCMTHVGEVSGTATTMLLRDLNWRWYVLFGVMVLAILIAAVVTFVGNSPSKISSPQATEAAVDTESIFVPEVLPVENVAPAKTTDSATTHQGDSTPSSQTSHETEAQPTATPEPDAVPEAPAEEPTE